MYRWATESDAAALKKLWCTDFEHHEPYFSWYFDQVYRPELTLCDFEGEALAANLQLAPYRLFLRGVAIPIVYLVGVITAPAFRHQGRGHALLRETHAYLRQEGYQAALFYTDIPAYYQPLAYRHCYRHQLLRQPLVEGVGGAALAEDWQTLNFRQDWPKLAPIYERMTQRYHGYLVRNEHNWLTYLGEQDCEGATVSLLPERAYVVATPTKEALVINEVGFVDENSLQTALAYAQKLAVAAAAEYLEWAAPVDGALLLPQIPALCWQERPFAMARLVDWPALLAAIHYPRDLNLRLNLTIIDGEGTEERQLIIADGVGIVQTELSDTELTARLSLAALTRLLFGDARWQQEAQDLSEQTRKRLQQCFPLCNNWINEYT